MSRNEKVENGKISARQEVVAACLAAGQTMAATARECRVGVTTIWVWKKQPPFRERLAELRQELVDCAVGRLADMMAGKAADALAKLLRAKSEGVRLDSVKAVYELFVNVTNAADLKARIEQLEARGAPPKGGR
jgi:hypothetical protein